MKIAIVKESKAGEKRVALTPAGCTQLLKNGFSVSVESHAGEGSSFEDKAYEATGASVVSNKNMLIQDAQILVKVNPWLPEEIAMMKEGQICFSLLYHLSSPETIQQLNAQKVSAFSMDAIPRISKAQSMDVLSSQSNLAGYKAVIEGASVMTKIFPMLMTAAGTITPAKVLIFGIGVAGLQAIATAKRLGAVVEATDVRPETKEQAESLGAKFIEVKSDGVKAEGGYAKEVSEDYQKKQKEAVEASLKTADLVITTALIPGRKAPVLITRQQVEMMKYGSVIVDMAAEQGGNCELSQPGEQVRHQGVTIVGSVNLPSHLATNASELYSKNLITFLNYLANSEGFKWDLEEEITKGTLICHQGQILRS